MTRPVTRHAEGCVNHLPCVFARPLLAQHAVCEFALRPVSQVSRATLPGATVRPGLVCAQPVARAVCARLSGLLRENSTFVLKLPAAGRKLTPAMLMRVQCGGLHGLKANLDPQALAPDVLRLLRLADARFGDLQNLPFSELVQGVAAWPAL